MTRYLVLFLFPALVVAGPGAVSQYLMREPVTMMDFGIYHMENYLDRLAPAFAKGDKGLQFVPSVFYDYDGDQIEIDVVISPIVKIFEGDLYPRSIDDAKTACKDAFYNIRLSLGVYEKDDQVQIESAANNMRIWFNHEGFSNASKPADLGRKLVGMTNIKISVTTSKGEFLRCHGPLMSTKHYIEAD